MGIPILVRRRHLYIETAHWVSAVVVLTNFSRNIQFSAPEGLTDNNQCTHCIIVWFVILLLLILSRKFRTLTETEWRIYCVSKLKIIGSDNGLMPCRCQAIIWSNAGVLLIGPLGPNFSQNLMETNTLPFMKMHLKMSSGKWRPFCHGLNMLMCDILCGTSNGTFEFTFVS